MMNWSASLSILSFPGVLSYILRGVAFTLVLSVLSVVISIALGSVLALCRNYCTGKSRVFRWIATVYIEVFRNTPLLLWIFICLVVCPCPKFFAHKMLGLTSVEMKILFRAVVALILFTSSVIAEIIRGGLNSISRGQFEAAYTQGFSTVQTMRYIILPQAFKAVLPALGNEFIVLLKETAVVGYIGLSDLTYAGNTVGGNTYEYLYPLLLVALVYLAFVMVLSWLLSKLEGRLRKSER